MFQKLIRKESEDFFLFLRGVKLHLYSQEKGQISKIMKEDYVSVISKYISYDVFYKPHKTTELTL